MSESEEINVPLLLGDLRSDNFDYKIQFAKRIGMIALAIGPERTRNELLVHIPGFLQLNIFLCCLIIIL
jgi:hypothetical protein